MGPGETGADLPVGDATPPAVIRDNVADRVYDPGAMQQARSVLEEEHGGARVSKVTGPHTLQGNNDRTDKMPYAWAHQPP